MIALLKVLLMKYLFARYLLGTVGSLIVVLPVAAILKTIGLPLLVILGIILFPLLIILLLVGLPVFAVLLCAAALLGLVGMFLVAGFVALKVAIFIVLPVLIVIWAVRKFTKSDTGGSATAEAR